MASRQFHTVQSANPEVKVIEGSFAPAGTGAPTDVNGKGFTVARTGVGTYLITLANKYAKFLSGTATMQLATGADIVPQLGTYSASARTLVLRLQAAAVATEVAADANNRVHFTLRFKNTLTP